MLHFCKNCPIVPHLPLYPCDQSIMFFLVIFLWNFFYRRGLHGTAICPDDAVAGSLLVWRQTVVGMIWSKENIIVWPVCFISRDWDTLVKVYNGQTNSCLWRLWRVSWEILFYGERLATCGNSFIKSSRSPYATILTRNISWAPCHLTGSDYRWKISS